LAKLRRNEKEKTRHRCSQLFQGGHGAKVRNHFSREAVATQDPGKVGVVSKKKRDTVRDKRKTVEID
jgi:hypothetical protein